MSKGDRRRPCQLSREHEELQWALAYGRISFGEYKRRYKELKKQGKIVKRF